MQNVRLDESQPESNLPGEISLTRWQMTPSLWQKEELKSLLMQVKEKESEEVWFKLYIQK